MFNILIRYIYFYFQSLGSARYLAIGRELLHPAGRSWMRVAEDRARWREIEEAFAQQWTVVG
jgi:hypothetical protein